MPKSVSGEINHVTTFWSRRKKEDEPCVSLRSSLGKCGLCHMIRGRMHKELQQALLRDGPDAVIHFNRYMQFEFDNTDARNLRGNIHAYYHFQLTRDLGGKAYSFAFKQIHNTPHNRHIFELMVNRWSDKVIVSTSTDSDVTFELAEAWLQDCVEGHDKCKVDRSNLELPSRLLSLDPVNTNTVRLVDTSTIIPAPAYTTLSHCWGAAKFLTLTAFTYERLHKGIDVSELPKTFQDAVRVTMKLGSRYLWIDSLCIFQDSKEDWQREAPLCNIAATASQSSNEGCFRTRDPVTNIPAFGTSYSNADNGARFVFHDDESWKQDVDVQMCQPLFSRGWVFQERLLAPRMLGFTSNHAFWECRTISATERVPCGYQNGTDLGNCFLSLLPGQPKIERIRFWNRAVSEYSGLNLTRGSDKLVAISAIAKRLQLLDKADNYIAGLWQSTFMQGIFYRTPSSGPGIYSVDRGSAVARPLPYRAPSWSWASLDGPICYEKDGDDIYDPEVLRAKCKALSTIESLSIYHATDIYGEVLHADLQIRGQLLKYEDLITGEGDDIGTDRLRFVSLGSHTQTYVCILSIYPDHQLTENNRKLLYFWPIFNLSGDINGLLLLKNGRVTYQRCGTFVIHRKNDNHRDNYVDHPSWPIRNRTNEEKMLIKAFWKGLEERTKKREDAKKTAGLESFKVTYIVGPPLEEESNNASEAQDGWKEYNEYDGEDCVFTIV